MKQTGRSVSAVANARDGEAIVVVDEASRMEADETIDWMPNVAEKLSPPMVCVIFVCESSVTQCCRSVAVLPWGQ